MVIVKKTINRKIIIPKNHLKSITARERERERERESKFEVSQQSKPFEFKQIRKETKIKPIFPQNQPREQKSFFYAN
jgi:hypothetical protein